MPEAWLTEASAYDIILLLLLLYIYYYYYTIHYIKYIPNLVLCVYHQTLEAALFLEEEPVNKSCLLRRIETHYLWYVQNNCNM